MNFKIDNKDYDSEKDAWKTRIKSIKDANPKE